MFAKKRIKQIKHNKLLFFCAQAVTYLLIRAIFATYRVHVIYDKTVPKPLHTTPAIFYAWHQNIIASAAFFFKNNFSLHCIASPSRDGKFVGALTQKIGWQILYGSAHKQPIALLRNALRVLRDNNQLFLIGDGSRGPAKQLQPGVTYLGQKAKLPVFFVDCKASRKLTLHKSWDKFQIPLPFSKISVTITQQFPGKVRRASSGDILPAAALWAMARRRDTQDERLM